MSNSSAPEPADGEADPPPPLGLTPILTVGNARAAAAFYVAAFGAREIARLEAPNGSGKLIHVRMQVEGSTFVFMDELPDLKFAGGGTSAPTTSGTTSVTLHLQVPDAQTVWTQAIAAGATVVVPLQEQFWGELYGRLRDPFGHEWTVAQMLRQLARDEIQKAATALL